MSKPLPIATETSEPFWTALKEHKIQIQQCDDCAAWVFYPRTHCDQCLSDQMTWREISGAATLYSYSIARIPTLPEFADEIPQKLAVIEFDEGPRMNTTLVFLEEDEIKIGMALKPHFDDVEGDVTLLRYTGLNSKPPVSEEPVAKPETKPESAAPKKQVKHNDIEAMKSLISEEFSGWSNEVEISQDLINEFAALSGDDYWIHTDLEKAQKLSPFGGTIAQGALTQVLMTRLHVPIDYEVVGFTNMANYGSNKLRFPSAVSAGSKVHARSRVKAIEATSNGTQMILELHTHVVGEERPAVINELMILYM